jgi:iron uptake system component EfeO
MNPTSEIDFGASKSPLRSIKEALVLRHARPFVATTLLLLVAGACSSDPGAHADEAEVTTVVITLTDAGCQPADVEVPSGPTTFEVTNEEASAVTELEVVREDGTILGEVEDIAPSLSGSFTLDLAPGTYRLACLGSGATPGSLTVTGVAGEASDESGLAEEAVAAYRSYVEDQAAQLTSRTRLFVEAIHDGDLQKARSLFAWAREPYERIEPIAESFGDLDPRIDAREGDVPAETWTGFHRIEQALWVDESLEGTEELADALLGDVHTLEDQIATVELQPAQIANGATELLNEVSSSKITGEEDRYSHTDLWDFQANVDGAHAAFVAVQHLLASQDPALVEEIEGRFVDVQRSLDPYRVGGGFVLYTNLAEADTRGLAQSINALAEPLSRVASLIVTA